MQLAVTYHSRPGAKLQSEVIEVTMTGTDPSDTLVPGPVEITGLREGVSAPQPGKRGGISGGKRWYMADKIALLGSPAGRYSRSAVRGELSLTS